MGIEEQAQQMHARQGYRNVWHTDLMSTVAANPSFCLFAMLCGPCASYMLRKRALYNNMSRYVCCAGYLPCSGNCGESQCPELCLCTEVFCCFANSVASTRFLLQDEFNIQTTECDNCIIGFMFCLSQLACICSLVACVTGSEEIGDLSQMLSCLSDLVFCSVCPCMQTQHKLEMDKRDGKFGQPPVMTVPPVQQMSRIDQPIPPQAGYPPPPQPGYPAPPQPGYPSLPQSGYPVPPQAGYPAPPPQYSYPVPNQHQVGYPPQLDPNAPMQQPYGQYPPPPHAQGYTPVGYPPAYGGQPSKHG